MFHFGLGEILLVILVAFLVLGPKELPRVLKSLGAWYGKIQKNLQQLKNPLNEAEPDSSKKESTERKDNS